MLELTESHTADVMGMAVRRALPRAGRRTVGPWCFVDHMGPLRVDPSRAIDVAPHPHIGLQTVTWLFEGEALHRDSLGSEQPIRPGQLNLMTAGHGVVHSEEGLGRSGRLHGVQLWVAQPDRTRHGSAAFEHHHDLPAVELGNATATVLAGSFAGATSPARRDTEHIGFDVRLRGETTIALDPTWEHAVVVVDGALRVAGDGRAATPGHLAYLPPGPSELTVQADGPAHAVVLGGAPFEAPIVMWWNYVARTRDEIVAANADWRSGDERFGDPGSSLPRVPSPDPPWPTAG